MYFTQKIQAGKEYLYWNPEEQLLLTVTDKARATPVEMVNEIMLSLLGKPDFTSNIQNFTSVTQVNATCLSYLQFANKFLVKKQNDAHPNMPRTKHIVDMIQSALDCSRNVGRRLKTACRLGREEYIKEHLSKGLSIEKKNYLVDIVFFHHRNLNILKILLEDGISDEKIDSLFLATDENDMQVVKLLLGFISVETAQRHLFMTRSLEVFDLLLQKGASIYEKDDRGWPLLCNAVFGENKEIVEYLLKTDLDVNQTTLKQSTPLHFAAMLGYVDIAKLLLRAGAKFDLKDECDLTAPEWAKMSGFDEADFRLNT